MSRRWAAAALLLAACDAPAPGAISGDAFLVEDVGREVNLGGLQVRLVAENVELDSALARLCPSRNGPPADPAAAHVAALAARRALLQQGVRATTRADGHATFRFIPVPPGRYRLWADTVVGPVRWSWLQPVTVVPAETLRVELSNANPDENPFRCGPKEHGPTEMTTRR